MSECTCTTLSLSACHMDDIQTAEFSILYVVSIISNYGGETY